MKPVREEIIYDEFDNVVYAEGTYDFEDEPMEIKGQTTCSRDRPWIFSPPENGCKKCFASVGFYATEPRRPHDNCNCRIIKCLFGAEADEEIEDALDDAFGDTGLDKVAYNVLEYSHETDIDTIELGVVESIHKLNTGSKAKPYNFHFTISQSDALSNAVAGNASAAVGFSIFNFGAGWTNTDTISMGSTRSETLSYTDEVLNPGEKGYIRVVSYVQVTEDRYYIKCTDIFGDIIEDEAVLLHFEYDHTEAELVIEKI